MTDAAQPDSTSRASTSGRSSPLSGAVPAQHPARSYALATKTATPTPSTPAGASAAAAQHAHHASDSPMNGSETPSMAQTGSHPAPATTVPNGAPADHTRKPPVVISSGYTPNGGPVSQNGRPPINFGSINSSRASPMPASAGSYQSHPASLPTPPRDPRVTSPAHSPSPIPQPSASGGRPPSSLQNQTNGMTFGSMSGDGQQMSQGAGIPVHERRTSSQSMVPPAGRGRGYPPQQQFGMPSPGPGYRQMAGQPRPPSNMGPQFQQQMPPGSPYNRGRGSPAVNHAQPNMPQHNMGGNPQMPFGYPAHMGAQHQQNMYNMPHFDPQGGYYQPYYPGYGQFAGQGPPSSPHRYPTPFNGQQGPMQPPFHPPSMSRSTSQASERPPSSMGQSAATSLQQSGSSANAPAAQPSFVKPSQKKSSAIKITDAQGNPLDFGKPKPSPTAAPVSQAPPPPTPQPQSTPLIVGAPSASTPTPPPRVPSAQQNRTELKSAKSIDDTRTLFQEQVRRKQEEDKRKEEEAAAAKAQAEKPVEAKTEQAEAKKEEVETTEPSKVPEVVEPAAKPVVEEAAAEAEKAAAVDAGDKEGEKAAEAAASTAAKDEGDKAEHEETEDERMDRMIAEMEAAEREREERENAYNIKRQKEKEEKAKLDAQSASKADEDLKRQEREAEERELQREREREQKDKDDSEQSKDLFSELKKPTLGPGASADDGAEEVASEDGDAEAPAEAPAADSNISRHAAPKPKTSQLKLETAKRVEPAEPTPGMQALKSARFLASEDNLTYPEGLKSPSPAVSLKGTKRPYSYDKEFLLQFQSVFKEKPSVDWDQKVKDTLQSDDSRARTPSSALGQRAPSGRGAQGGMAFGSAGGAMGQFQQGGPRTLPAGTTSQQRFAASSSTGMGALPGNTMARAPSQLGMGAGINRNASLQGMAGMGTQSPRQQSSRGSKAGGSRRGPSRKDDFEANSKMPLTAHMDLAPLQKSQTGWKPTSIGAPMAAGPDLSGNMAPDMVQRKVKAALNKMTPEKFDKIADSILEIAAQSKNETDGRTLRQVIQLTFEKACDEAHWAGMYAQFCSKMLVTMSNDIRDETIKDKAGQAVVGGALFRKYLLNRCQEEFERGWQINLPDKPEGEEQEIQLLSDEYYIAAAAKRRGLGLIQFIGQLYKLRMLTLRIMHECVLKLLNFEGDPDEAAVENLTTLLRAVGPTMDEDENGRKMIGAYFQRIDDVLLKSDKLASRPRFMIMDLVDLRRVGWKGKQDTKGPKTIQQIHEEAEAAAAKADAERARQSQRGPPGGRPGLGRGDARNFSGNAMPPPVDHNRTTVNMDDMRRLQNRTSSARPAGASLGPSLGPGSLLSNRSGSRRGAGLGGPSSGNTTRTNTPPVEGKDKKDEPSAQQNAFSALASLDASGEGHEETEAPAPAAAATAAAADAPADGDKAEGASA